MSDPMITKYCLEVQFEGLDQGLYFEVEEAEFFRLRKRWETIVDPREFVAMTMSDGTEVLIAVRNVETMHFLFERSLEEIPTLRLVKEEEGVVKYHLLGRHDPDYLPIASAREAVELHSKLKTELESGRWGHAGLFCSISDGDGKSFLISLSKLLYIAIPKAVMDEGNAAIV